MDAPWCMCGKRLQYYVTGLIDAILSVISGYITEQHILAIDCNHLFQFVARKMTS